MPRSPVLVSDTPPREDGGTPAVVGHRLGPRVWGVAALLAVLATVVASDAVHGVFLEAVAWAEPMFATRPVVGAVLFVVLGAASAALAFVSSSALVPVAIGVWGLAGTAALLWIGWMLGGVASYGAGRGLSRAAGRLNPRGVVARTLGRIRPDSPLWVVALVQFAVQSEISGLVLGAARYPLSRYIASLAVVEVVFAGLTVAAGAALVGRHVELLVAAVAGLALLVAGSLAVLHRRLPSS